MPVLTYLFLLLCYLLSGYGLLTLFGMRLKAAYMITLSLLLGVAVASFIPFLLQLFYVVITGPTVFGALLLAALLLNIPSFLQIRKEGGAAFIRRFRPSRFRMRNTVARLRPAARAICAPVKRRRRCCSTRCSTSGEVRKGQWRGRDERSRIPQTPSL